MKDLLRLLTELLKHTDVELVLTAKGRKSFNLPHKKIILVRVSFGDCATGICFSVLKEGSVTPFLCAPIWFSHALVDGKKINFNNLK